MRDELGTSGHCKRFSRRQRVLKKGFVEFHGNGGMVPCLIHDLSENGARLSFRNPLVGPPNFDLHVELDSFKVACARIWRDAKSCGVKFVGEKKPTKVVRQQIVDPLTTSSPNCDTGQRVGVLIVDGGVGDGSEAKISESAVSSKPQSSVFGRRR